MRTMHMTPMLDTQFCNSNIVGTKYTFNALGIRGILFKTAIILSHTWPRICITFQN